MVGYIKIQEGSKNITEIPTNDVVSSLYILWEISNEHCCTSKTSKIV